MKELGDTYEELKKKLNKKVRKVFQEYEDIIKNSNTLKESYKNDCIDILNNKEFDADDAIYLLCDCLYQIYDQYIIVLIDEYDDPFVKGYEEGYYSDAVKLLRKFYGVLLKDNAYVKFAVVFGIERFSKTSIYSSLNNLK